MFVVPALRKVREGRGTHSVGDAGESKTWGIPLQFQLLFVDLRFVLVNVGLQLHFGDFGFAKLAIERG